MNDHDHRDDHDYHDHHDHCDHRDDRDEAAARVFAALCDPTSVRLLLHALHVGEWDSAGQPDGTSCATAACLQRLVAAGLMVKTSRAGERHVYRVADPATVERLLAMVGRLGTRSHETSLRPD